MGKFTRTNRTVEKNNERREQENDNKELYTQQKHEVQKEEESVKRKRTLWEDIGLAEYSPEAQIWGIDDCGSKIDTSKKISHGRKKHQPEQYFGPDQQEMTSPYCRKTMNALGRLLIHMEVKPREGNWNIETCQKLQQNDTPRDKWAKLLLKMNGIIHEVKLQQQKTHSKQEKN